MDASTLSPGGVNELNRYTGAVRDLDQNGELA